jgi:hypothetical protein
MEEDDEQNYTNICPSKWIKWTTWIMKYYHMDEINQLMIFENMDEKINH